MSKRQLRVQCSAPVGSLLLQVDLCVESSWAVLFGPSGSGKSSLLRLLAGLWSPPGSVVQFRGEDLSASPPHLRRIGLVAQQPALFPHLHALANIEFGAARGTGGAKRVASLLDLYDLHGLTGARVQYLSGGERQRVALARALAASPRLLLLDEVFTGMHLSQRDSLLQRTHAYCAEHDVPVVSVTHDVVEAGLVAGEVIKLERGQVVLQGTADDVLSAERASLFQALGRTEGATS